MVTFFGTEITYQIQTKINLCFSLPILISLTTLGSQFTWIAPTKGPEEYYCVTSGGSRNFFYGVIKKLKLNKNLIKKKKNLNILSYRKKNTHTHTQIDEILQFHSTSFHILKSSHDSLLYVFIIYCQCKYDHFILLSLYNIFVLSYCGYIFVIFYKNILN